MTGSDHGARVRAWFRDDPSSLSPDLLIRRFEEGFSRVWDRACPTLGDITLVAIADRVLRDLAAEHPALAGVQVDASGLRGETLDRLREVDDAALGEMLPEVLTQLLEVVGRLTAEILTPALHAALDVEAAERPREPASRRERSRSSSDAPRANAEKDRTS